MLAIHFFVDGFSELITAFSVSEGRGWLIFDAVVTIIPGIMIFTGFPFASLSSSALFRTVSIALRTGVPGARCLRG